MTSEQAYIQFLMLVNRNATNNNTNVDRLRFVKMYRNAEIKFVEWSLDKRNEDSIRNIQALLVPEKSLVLDSAVSENYTTFNLPVDYFDYANIKAKAESECCENETLLVYEVKSEDIEEKINDKYSEPSFEWRETFGFLSENKFTVYKKNFEISELLLTYYRYPVKMDIGGYINNDGTQSSNIDPEFDDKVVDKILLIAAKQFSGINEDSARENSEKDRLFNI